MFNNDPNQPTLSAASSDQKNSTATNGSSYVDSYTPPKINGAEPISNNDSTQAAVTPKQGNSAPTDNVKSDFANKQPQQTPSFDSAKKSKHDPELDNTISQLDKLAEDLSYEVDKQLDQHLQQLDERQQVNQRTAVPQQAQDSFLPDEPKSGSTLQSLNQEAKQDVAKSKNSVNQAVSQTINDLDKIAAEAAVDPQSVDSSLNQLAEMSAQADQVSSFKNTSSPVAQDPIQVRGDSSKKVDENADTNGDDIRTAAPFTKKVVIPQEERLVSQNIFEMLGLSDSQDSDKEKFLDELQQAIWEDFLETDLELMVATQEKEEVQKILADNNFTELEKQEKILAYLEKLIPDLESILMEKAIQLKRELVQERVAGMREYYANNQQAIETINKATQLIVKGRWKSGIEILNSVK